MLAGPLLAKRLRRLILFRLLCVAFFLTAGAMLFHMDQVIYYGTLSLLIVMSLIYAIWLLTKRALSWLAYTQIAMDLLIESVLVYYTGAVDSVLAILYAVSIIIAGLVLTPKAHLVTAYASCFIFVGTVGLNYFGWTPPSFLPEVHEEFQTTRELFYTIYMTYVRVAVLLLVGFLANYLSSVLSMVEQRAKVSTGFSLLGETAAHIAHEIKNPLAAISGSIEVLHESLKDRLSRSENELMTAVVNESERVKGIFEKILDYAKPESLELEPLPLDTVLDEAFLVAENFPTENGQITIERVYEGKKMRIYADRNRIKQVFLNLAFNAFQAMPHGGKLKVDCHETTGESYVTFEDTGTGMSKERLRTLFVPFNSEKRTGTGLGLAIANKIVKNHGGRIRVKSQAGRGSRFEVVLPKF